MLGGQWKLLLVITCDSYVVFSMHHVFTSVIYIYTRLAIGVYNVETKWTQRSPVFGQHPHKYYVKRFLPKLQMLHASMFCQGPLGTALSPNPIFACAAPGHGLGDAM